jgi:predicted nucleic acid-binding protein
MGKVLLKLVDASGPVTLALGKRIVDVCIDGQSEVAVGTITWSEFAGRYTFRGEACFSADELAWIAAAIYEMESK